MDSLKKILWIDAITVLFNFVFNFNRYQMKKIQIFSTYEEPHPATSEKFAHISEEWPVAVLNG